MRNRKNAGHFRPGYDPRRHVFTQEERSRGGKTTFLHAMDNEPWLLRWLQRKIDATRRAAR